MYLNHAIVWMWIIYRNDTKTADRNDSWFIWFRACQCLVDAFQNRKSDLQYKKYQNANDDIRYKQKCIGIDV